MEHSLRATERMQEPDALEGEAGEHSIPVMEESKQLVQLDHCVRERDLFSALGPKFVKDILTPLVGDHVVCHIPLVGNPEHEIRISLRKMIAQHLNLFSWRGALLDIFRGCRAYPIAELLRNGFKDCVA